MAVLLHKINNENKRKNTFIKLYDYLLKEFKANKAAFISKILHFQEHSNLVDKLTNQRWVGFTQEKWGELLGVDRKTVNRMKNDLEELGILIAKNLNSRKSDHMLWYRIDEDILYNYINSTTEKKGGAVTKVDQKNYIIHRLNKPNQLEVEESYPQCPKVRDNLVQTYKENNIRNIYNTPPKSPSQSTNVKKEQESKVVNLNTKKIDYKNPQRINQLQRKLDQQYQTNVTKHMYKLWQQIVIPKLHKSLNWNILPKKLFTFFKNQMQGSMDNWREYLEKISSSDFLTGNISIQEKEQLNNPDWAATISWVVCPSNFEKIEQGKYNGKHYNTAKLQYEREIEEEVVQTFKNETVPLFKEVRKSLVAKFGENKYLLWFKEVEFKLNQKKEVLIVCKSQYIADLLHNNCESWLIYIFSLQNYKFIEIKK